MVYGVSWNHVCRESETIFSKPPLGTRNPPVSLSLSLSLVYHIACSTCCFLQFSVRFSLDRKLPCKCYTTLEASLETRCLANENNIFVKNETWLTTFSKHRCVSRKRVANRGQFFPFFFFFSPPPWPLFVLGPPSCILSVCAYFSVSICTTFYSLFSPSVARLLRPFRDTVKVAAICFNKRFCVSPYKTRHIIINFRLCRAQSRIYDDIYMKDRERERERESVLLEISRKKREKSRSYFYTIVFKLLNS